MKIKCSPCKVQKGDKVLTPKGSGVVTAVGVQAVGRRIASQVVRAGPSQYWQEWQVKLLGRG